MASVTVVSVMRDKEMYERCMMSNSFFAEAELCPVDNSERNEAIPVCYNGFIKSRSAKELSWHVFCHEDFELRDRLVAIVECLDKGASWWPIGVVTHKAYVGFSRKIAGRMMLWVNCWI